jgi:predicted nucleotidyltransferase
MLTKLIEAAGFELLVDAVARPGGARGLPDTPMGRRLRRRRRALIDEAALHGATNLRIFGSVARGEDTDDSDVDLLVDLDEAVGVVGLVGLERELEALVGRKVDVVPASGLKRRMSSEVLAEAIPL